MCPLLHVFPILCRLPIPSPSTNRRLRKTCPTAASVRCGLPFFPRRAVGFLLFLLPPSLLSRLLPSPVRLSKFLRYLVACLFLSSRRLASVHQDSESSLFDRLRTSFQGCILPSTLPARIRRRVVASFLASFLFQVLCLLPFHSFPSRSVASSSFAYVCNLLADHLLAFSTSPRRAFSFVCSPPQSISLSKMLCFSLLSSPSPSLVGCRLFSIYLPPPLGDLDRSFLRRGLLSSEDVLLASCPSFECFPNLLLQDPSCLWFSP